MSTSPSERVFVLGAGRAGLSLAAALQAAGVPLAAVHGRRSWQGTDGALARLPHTSGPLSPESLAAAAVVLVTVRDAQLDDVLRLLAAVPLRAGTVVLHASGAGTPAAEAALRACGVAVGTFHPLLPLAAPELAAERLRGAWIGLDGDAAAVAAGARLAAALGAHTLGIPAGRKGAYHAAAALASNLPVTLAVLAGGLLRAAGVPADEADGAVRSLMGAAVRNLERVPLDAGGGARALTGPLARGDRDTVQAHLDSLAGAPAARGAYLALASATLQMLADAAAAGGDGEASPPPAALRALVRAAQVDAARALLARAGEDGTS